MNRFARSERTSRIFGGLACRGGDGRRRNNVALETADIAPINDNIAKLP